MSDTVPSEMSGTVPISIECYDLILGGGIKVARCAKLSHCCDYVVMIDDARKVYVCRLSTAETFTVPVRGKATAIALNEDFEFAVASDEGIIQRFDLSLPILNLGTIKVGQVTSMAYDPSGVMLVCGLANGWTQAFDLESSPGATMIGARNVADDRPIPLIMARKDMVIGVDKDGIIFCLREPLSKSEPTHYGRGHLDWDCWAMAKHPYLANFVVGGSGPYFRHYPNFNLAPTFLVSSFPFIRDFAFIDRRHQVAVIGNNGVEIFNLETNSVVFRWKNEKGKVLCARSKLDRLLVICA